MSKTGHTSTLSLSLLDILLHQTLDESSDVEVGGLKRLESDVRRHGYRAGALLELYESESAELSCHRAEMKDEALWSEASCWRGWLCTRCTHHSATTRHFASSFLPRYSFDLTRLTLSSTSTPLNELSAPEQ